MKIIHCLIHYLPQHIAGTEVYTHTLAKLQKAKGHQVVIITSHIEFYDSAAIKEHYVYDGIDVYQFMETANPTNRDIYTGKKKPEGLNNFLALLKMLKPDVINFHGFNRSIGITVEHLKLAKLAGAKVFVTMHLSFYTCNTNILITKNKLCEGKIKEFDCTACTYNSMFNIPLFMASPLARLSNLFTHTQIRALLPTGKLTTFISIPSTINRIKNDLSELVENSNQIISLTEWYKKILLLNNVPADKITVIPQALAVAKQPTLLKNKYTINLPLKLVFLGRIENQKGVHLIIEAFKKFSVAEVIVDIYGKEEPTEYYKKWFEESIGFKNIFWKGLLHREEILEKLADYDLLCVPSLSSEMSPLVIQEAFAAGIPVLASKGYGNMEQIRHGENGLLFNFNSADSLAEQLKLIINNPELINQMKSKIMPPADFESVCNSYLNLYQSV